MISRAFERNLGFMSSTEQDRLQNSVVSVAGVGGDGGLMALQLARMGIGELRLADPDIFELENTNRQAVCNSNTIGMNKAVAVSECIKSINSNISTVVYDQGINESNVGEFVKGADLVIDETEFTLHALAVMIARAARAESIPNMTAFNIGFGTVSTTYHPKGPKLEKRLGFSEHQSLDEISRSKVGLDRWLPYLPSYGDIKVLDRVSKGEKSAPSIAPGVSIAAAVGVTQAFLNLIEKLDNNRPKPVYAPKAIVMDAMSVKADIIKFNRVSHYRSLFKVVVNNMLNLNPKASY